MEQRALTIRSKNGRLPVLQTKACVAPIGFSGNPDSLQELNAIWDTGATNTAMDAGIAKKLKLIPTGVRQVHTASGILDTETYLVDIFFKLNKVAIRNMEVTAVKLGNADMLIGMDIITMGDFAITNADGRTTMSFRTPSMKLIDFVPESNLHNMKLTKRLRQKTSSPTKNAQVSRKKKKKKRK